ncbi:MAG: GNAT family N-acetyltransferase [Butyrivibrio sp.]|jgi:GNAT superfamily N-acetyltransferase|nr:GNAT family N-acetyltransferase [Butyrivibrio sp.]
MNILAVDNADLDRFEHYIPSEMMPRLKSGEYFCIAAFNDDGTAAFGVMVFKISAGICEICWVCVAEAYRRRGTMLYLYQNLLTHLLHQDITEIELWLHHEDSNAPMIDFALRMGFSFAEESAISVQVPVSRLCQNSFFDRKVDTSNVISLDELPASSKTPMIHSLLNELPLCSTPDEFLSLYHSGLSLFYLHDHKINACLLMSYDGDQRLELSYLYVSSDSAAVMPILLIYELQELKEHGLDHLTLSIAAINEASIRLVNSLAPDAVTEPAYHMVLPLR